MGNTRSFSWLPQATSIPLTTTTNHPAFILLCMCFIVFLLQKCNVFLHFSDHSFRMSVQYHPYVIVSVCQQHQLLKSISPLILITLFQQVCIIVCEVKNSTCIP